ncbi:MAG: hypothetical protein ACUVWR_04645 [Anaerolineae bacterium]
MRKVVEPTAIERVTLRMQRFVRALRPSLSNLDRALAEEWLTAKQLRLFLSQSPEEQRHAISVTRLLLHSGYASRDLIAAALLHDVAKRGATFTPWHRTAIVLLEAFAPWLLQWLGSCKASGILAPFAVHASHASVGSRLARDAGASERVAHLISKHHERGADLDEELYMLRWADDHA